MALAKVSSETRSGFRLPSPTLTIKSGVPFTLPNKLELNNYNIAKDIALSSTITKFGLMLLNATIIFIFMTYTLAIIIAIHKKKQ